jgi:hypothetical protein
MKVMNIRHPENKGSAAGAQLYDPRVEKSNASAATFQHLIDQVVGFNLYACPDPRSKTESESGSRGFLLNATLNRFDILLQPPSKPGVQASNILGETVGRLNLHWFMIPDDLVARPDIEPPAYRLDATISQRFVMQEAIFTFGDGRDGFRSFGTGRTFPTTVGNQPQVVVAAIGNVVDGFGKFQGHEGNFTICGDLRPEGFEGHILVRIIDPLGKLRTQAELPAVQAQTVPDLETTYLQWGAQKGVGAGQENRFSIGPDGQPRGMNIPTQLKLLHLDFANNGEFQGKDFEIGDAIGGEVGFGKGSVPGASLAGTSLSPFLFDGVAKYSFHDSAGKAIGSVTTNVIEGRRFDMKLPGASNPPALRFGFFGPIVCGTGCFQGAEGIFYGATGSVLMPPPGIHVITHFYAARIHDPQGKFRARMAEGYGGLDSK